MSKRTSIKRLPSEGMTQLARVIDDVRFATLCGADQALILTLVQRWADREGKCWPSVKKVAGVLGKSDRAVSASLARLEAVGMILRPDKSGGKDSNDIWIIPANLTIEGDDVNFTPTAIEGDDVNFTPRMTATSPGGCRQRHPNRKQGTEATEPAPPSPPPSPTDDGAGGGDHRAVEDALQPLAAPGKPLTIGSKLLHLATEGLKQNPAAVQALVAKAAKEGKNPPALATHLLADAAKNGWATPTITAHNQRPVETEVERVQRLVRPGGDWERLTNEALECNLLDLLDKGRITADQQAELLSHRRDITPEKTAAGAHA